MCVLNSSKCAVAAVLTVTEKMGVLLCILNFCDHYVSLGFADRSALSLEHRHLRNFGIFRGKPRNRRKTDNTIQVLTTMANFKNILGLCDQKSIIPVLCQIMSQIMRGAIVCKCMATKPRSSTKEWRPFLIGMLSFLQECQTMKRQEPSEGALTS